jgi:hypothetical protein
MLAAAVAVLIPLLVLVVGVRAAAALVAVLSQQHRK